MRRVSALFAYLAAATLTLSAQSPRTIHGRVVDDVSGEPIRNARVAAITADAAPVLTGPDGQFAIGVSGGDSISAMKTGYVRGTVAAGDTIEIRLARGGVITGHALDDQGGPLPLLTVVAQRIVRAGGRTTFEPVASAVADDRGEYRSVRTAGGRIRARHRWRGTAEYAGSRCRRQR